MRRTEPQLHATVVRDPPMLVNGTKDPSYAAHPDFRGESAESAQRGSFVPFTNLSGMLYETGRKTEVSLAALPNKSLNCRTCKKDCQV